MHIKLMEKYFAKHVWENSAAHMFLGLGAGFVLTHPLADPHPLRWGLIFLTVGVVWHLKAGMKN